MSSGLFFNGAQFPGMVLAFSPPAWDLHPYETHFAGVDGVSRISGGSGRRVIEIPVLLFDTYGTRDELEDYIEDTLNGADQIDTNGELFYQNRTQGKSRSYADCQYEGFWMQTPPGALLDVAGTLDGGWFCLGLLRFVELSEGG